MIPKIIHFCWLSNDPFPDEIQKCMNSWKTFLPDYEFIHWNFQRFPKEKSQWVSQAFDKKKYAFAADYIRLYALYNYGGIYLDTDVEVLKSFNDLLDLPYFIGKESTPSGIEAAVLGSEPKNLLIKSLLDSYEGRNFVKEDGAFENTPLPFLFRRCIDSQYLYRQINSKEEFSYDKGIINIFPVDYFSPKKWDTKELKLTENTYSIHHFAGSWLSHTDLKEENQINIEVHIKKYLSAVLRFIFFRKDVSILSNAAIADKFGCFFNMNDISTLSGIKISQDDFLQFIKLDDPFSLNHIEFIFRSSSKYKNKIFDFYPIGRIKGTDVEIHFQNCFSCDQAMELWKKRGERIKRTYVYHVFASDNADNIFEFKSLKNIRGATLSLKNSDLNTDIRVDSLDMTGRKDRYLSVLKLAWLMISNRS